jgi:hypothetical protein
VYFSFVAVKPLDFENFASSPREELELLRRDIVNEMKQTFGKMVKQALQGVAK